MTTPILEVIESQSLFRHYGPRPLHRASALEKAFAQAMGAPHALAVTAGTAAIITALAACAIGPGDEVAVPTYTWIATINAVVILGAVPLFVDIDESLNMDASALEAAITGRPWIRPSRVGPKMAFSVPSPRRTRRRLPSTPPS